MEGDLITHFSIFWKLLRAGEFIALGDSNEGDFVVKQHPCLHNIHV